MKKITARIIWGFLFVSLLCCFGGTSTFAAGTSTPVFKRKLIWNIENVHYFLNPSVNGYSGLISSAADNWVHTGCGYNKLYPNTQTSNKLKSTVDFYTYSASGTTIAYTSFFKRANGTTGKPIEVDPNSENWLYAEIHINNQVMSSLSDYNKKGTIVHEFGHAWGLAHNQTNPNSIMCQLAKGRKVNTVQPVDNKAFNSKY